MGDVEVRLCTALLRMEPGVDPQSLLYTLLLLLWRPRELRGVEVGESCCRLRWRSCTEDAVTGCERVGHQNKPEWQAQASKVKTHRHAQQRALSW